MELAEFLKKHVVPAAEYSPGNSVWVISNKQPVKTRVLAIIYKLCSGEKDEIVLVHVGYDLDLYRGGSLEYDSYELYPSAEEATQATVWHEVKGFSKKEWLAAIGNRDEAAEVLIARLKGKRRKEVEEVPCELFVCCPNVSTARDYLIACKKEQGMMERDRKNLKALIEEDLFCSHVEAHPHPILDRILAKLDIRMSAKEAQEAQ